MTLETFNVLLVTIGAPTVVLSVGMAATVLVKRQTEAINAYIRATEPNDLPVRRPHADAGSR